VLHKFLIRQDALAMAKIAHSDFLGYQKRSRRQPDRIAGRWNRGSSLLPSWHEPRAAAWQLPLDDANALPRSSKTVLFGHRSPTNLREQNVDWLAAFVGREYNASRSDRYGPPRFLSFRLLMRQRSQDRSNRVVRNAQGK
jgi:hypothetical protein